MADRALELIRSRYPEAIVYPEEGDSAGYVLFQVKERLTYELVTRVQAEMWRCWRGHLCAARAAAFRVCQRALRRGNPGDRE